MEKPENSDDRPRKLVEIAVEIGRPKGVMKKLVERRFFKPFKLRKTQSAPWYLSAQDAKAFIHVEGEWSNELMEQTSAPKAVE